MVFYFFKGFPSKAKSLFQSEKIYRCFCGEDILREWKKRLKHQRLYSFPGWIFSPNIFNNYSMLGYYRLINDVQNRMATRVFYILLTDDILEQVNYNPFHLFRTDFFERMWKTCLPNSRGDLPYLKN